ncbi:MAG TPA: DotU family type IV/VI secretion system protein [Bryobacteraceae bacterium]|nr:DotU family type IV/VI secretion system protein [Bryobacteraceae bacterium]
MAAELPGSHDRLALLYEGILTAIVRIQSGRQQLQSADAFRQRIKGALGDIAEAALRRGYNRQLVQDASFAVVAFLDEAVLSSQGLGQAQWARKNLQEELFEQRSAGELFFRHLEDLRTHEDSTQLAEVLEVYYLCLLLGYEGRYASGSKAELHIMMDNVREKIERVFGSQAHFSPDWMQPDQTPAVAAPDPLPRRLRLAAAGAAAVALLCFFTFSCHLHLKTDQLEGLAKQSATR